MLVSVSRSTPPTRPPDLAQGVFERLLVLDGRPVELDAHLARLKASLAELYPDRVPPHLDVPTVDRLSGRSTAGTSALRIVVAPAADGELAVTIERRPPTGPFAPDLRGRSSTEAVGLRSLRLLGGLGAHKWADRALLDEAQAELPKDALPLILDEDGAVLEASRANVFAVQEGTLVTPPLDGRILPGVTRMRVLELAGPLGVETAEARLSHDDLLTAGEVFLTGSVRGVESAVSFDGTPLAGTGEIASLLDAELRHAWAA